MSYTQLLKKDLDFGTNQEVTLKSKIEKYFNCTLNRTKQYHKFDFISIETNKMFELKSRSNYYNTYPTTMISFHKYNYSLNTDYECYFLFNFLDGLYYYKINDNTLKECSVGKGGRKDRGRFEYNQYLYIPIELLKKID